MSAQTWDYLPEGARVRYEFPVDGKYTGVRDTYKRGIGYRFGEVTDPGYPVPDGFVPVRFEDDALVSILPGDGLSVIRDDELRSHRSRQKMLDAVDGDIERLRPYDRRREKCLTAKSWPENPGNCDETVQAFVDRDDNDEPVVVITAACWARILVDISFEEAEDFAKSILYLIDV